jgi:gamma-glutamyltranspeptidase/glutathione hydrolase
VPTVTRRAGLATSQVLAVQAGLKVLQDGGNAVDAAICAAACLCVVEPASTGIGGDLFALVHEGGQVYALNASGRAPAALNAPALRARGLTAVGDLGWDAVTVPGTVSGWDALSKRFGSAPLADLLQPAIRFASEGFGVSPTVARAWKANAHRLQSFPEGAGELLPGGRAPEAGEVVTIPTLAESLRKIAAGGRRAFYEEIASEIVAASDRAGGWLTMQDFQRHVADWVEAISAEYRGWRIWEAPPNGQGIIALQALQILEGFDLGAYEPLDPELVHLQIEACKLATEDARRYVADPATASVPIAGLLAPAYAGRRRGEIARDAVHASALAGLPAGHDTVYVAAADQQFGVSLIQSTFWGFGSGVVVPGTGITLQNRGAGFSLEPGHLNELAGGKRPFHTIIPGLLERPGECVAPFGVMGGPIQPQGHVQVVCALLDQGLNAQAALDLPRFRYESGAQVAFEQGYPQATVEALLARGHQRFQESARPNFGGGQIVMRDLRTGVFVGASDPRKDGAALGV